MRRAFEASVFPIIDFCVLYLILGLGPTCPIPAANKERAASQEHEGCNRVVLSLLHRVHLRHDFFDSEAMHQLYGLSGEFGIFLRRLGFGDVYLRAVEHSEKSSGGSLSAREIYHGDIKVIQISPPLRFRLDNVDLLESEGPLVPDIGQD
jgi:hypothetical protein